MPRAIMIQGAGSNVGKSIFVAGLARHFAKAGLSVAPFKPQNMSNNAAVTEDGGEIGRAQALQARAAYRAPGLHMNPVLLKPENDTGAQVIVQGKRYATLTARDYGSHKKALLPRIMESFAQISSQADLILVEGAGSPAEVNLRQGDIANMGFAQEADIPVMLLGDIDRGGVIAQMVGTNAVLSKQDRNRIKAFAVNKFRGDVSLFASGAKTIAEHTGWTDVGTLPWFANAWRLPAEDIMDLRGARNSGPIKIAVPKLNRIANFDDLDPLSAEPAISVEIVEPGRALPGDADLVLIPGSKNTISDLQAFKANGWDIDLAAHIRRGGQVLGICGGYQMLGKKISDPDGIEGAPGTYAGLGHLDISTLMKNDKTLSRVTGRTLPDHVALAGYEIHIGQTTGPDCSHPWLEVEGKPHGASSPNRQIRGCYVHGLFSSDAFRANFLTDLGAVSSQTSYDVSVEQTLDELAMHMNAHLDLDRLFEIAQDV